MRCARRASEGRQAAEEDEQGVLWANGQFSAPKNCRVRSLGGGNRARGARGEGLTALSQTGEQRLKELRQEGADVPLGTIEDWLEKRAKRLSAAQSNRYRGLGVSQRGGITPGGLGDHAGGQGCPKASYLSHVLALGTRGDPSAWHTCLGDMCKCPPMVLGTRQVPLPVAAPPGKAGRG